ncbi:protein NRT1/ PTR FAMILY 4.5-like [Apium graveolens]|uniref:protein NRT1/ PTR FAMILY 4.5-like n=1 Tax=Apium graveolens TaxID=4045 RepID=UPI003D7A9F9A
MTNSGEIEPKHKQGMERGGLRATLFVFVTTTLESIIFVGNAVSLFVYFYGTMNFSLTRSATMLTNYMGSAYIFSLLGGFICDTFLLRFTTCVLFGSIQVVGYVILTIQAFTDHLKPAPCKDITLLLMNKCEKSDDGQVFMLYTGLYLVALGVGGIKAAVPSLGADQYDEKDPEEAMYIPTYFNWYFFSFVCGAVVGTTFLVWVNTYRGWDWGFLVSTLTMLAAVLFLCTGVAFFRHSPPKGSPLTRIAQVFVAAFKNRHLERPETAEGYYEITDNKDGNETEILKNTNQFKFLDRAAIIRTADSSNSGPWSICTMTQVEETKIVVRMLPIIGSTIFLNTCLAQLQTFTVQQANTLDRNVIGIHVPSSSIPVIPLGLMVFAVPIYDRFCVPALRKLTGIPTGIRQLQRIGVGLVLATISMLIGGYVETRRKRVAVHHNMVDSPNPLPMNVMWLGFQYGVFGMADMFTMVGLLDFFYSESSAGMKSLGIAFTWLSSSIGYYLSTVIVNIVDDLSGGWFKSNNLNRDKLNYYYYLFAGLSTLNFGFYLLCSSWYRYKDVEVKEIEGESKVEMGSV